jgi:aspartate/methionine/tyrosine aminotransferase
MTHSLPTLASLADRTYKIEPFHTMELIKHANELAKAGRSIIHMSIGEPDFTAPPPVVHALERAVQSGETGYTAAVGIEPLRNSIAHYYGTEFNVELDPSRVVITAGASAALSLACCALVNPGDHVLLSDPNYPCNRHFIAAFDGIAQGIAVGPETRFQLTAELVEKQWGANVRGTLLASPANPTGTSIPFDELGRIVDVVRGHRGFTLVDEIYLGLHYDSVARSVLEYGSDIVVTNSFSKFFNMTGWRLGWLVVPPEWLPTFEKLSQNLYICASTLAQRAALACFEPESMVIFAARREEFRARRDYIVPALRELGFIIPVTPDGAFYVYLDCSNFSKDSGAFARRMLEEIGVAIVPGGDFGSYQPERYLRLSYATNMEQLQQAVRRMAQWLPSQHANEEKAS